jgi:hypothetical protein
VEVTAVTRNAVAVACENQEPVMPPVCWDLYQTMVQTLSVLNDLRVIAALRQVEWSKDAALIPFLSAAGAAHPNDTPSMVRVRQA